MYWLINIKVANVPLSTEVPAPEELFAKDVKGFWTYS